MHWRRAASSCAAPPLLLTQAGALPAATSRALRDLGVSAVTVVGGDRAVSPAVVSQLGVVDARVTRISGVDRYDTAARVADSVDNAGREILLATVANFPDALENAAVARRLNATLVLTAPGAMSVAASNYLGRYAPEGLTVLGGNGAVSRRAESQFATVHLQ